LAAMGLCPPVTAKLQHKCQEQRSAVTERPGDRGCEPPLSMGLAGSGGGIRALRAPGNRRHLSRLVVGRVSQR
jgi:hypothetical protein